MTPDFRGSPDFGSAGVLAGQLDDASAESIEEHLFRCGLRCAPATHKVRRRVAKGLLNGIFPTVTPSFIRRMQAPASDPVNTIWSREGRRRPLAPEDICHLASARGGR
jgi:hypothetical protein